MREMYFSSQPMEMTDMAALEQTFRMINGGNTAALFIGLSALGFRSALDNLRSSIPERTGKA